MSYWQNSYLWSIFFFFKDLGLCQNNYSFLIFAICLELFSNVHGKNFIGLLKVKP